jgi:large conductance mechanosensitive channel
LTYKQKIIERKFNPLLLTPAQKAFQAEDLDQLTWGAVKYGRFLASVIKLL